MGKLVQLENTEHCNTEYRGRVWFKDNQKVKLGVNQMMTLHILKHGDPVITIEDNGKLMILGFERGSFFEWNDITIIYRATEFDQFQYANRLLVEFAYLNKSRIAK